MAGVDRISELPDSILHRILSPLSQKQAIQTSVLSRRWRHVGPTRPKIEWRESFFRKSGRATFLSVIGKTLQRYYDRNLSVHEFIFDMSSSESNYHPAIDSETRSLLDSGIPIVLSDTGLKKLDFSVPYYALSPSVVFRAEFLTELCLGECNFMSTNDNDQPLFNGLKRLSLNKVLIEAETLEKIIRTCPLIEYLSLSCHVGYSTTIPVALNLSVFPAESYLEELHLIGCNLISTCSSTELLLIKRLKTLSLDNVGILEETLDKIMCSCPLIERVLLSGCVGLTTIQLNQPRNNYNYNMNRRPTRFTRRIRTQSFETICLKWYCHDKYFFPRLKSLYLHSVKLSTEIFESFSSNFPSLEELELQNCSGFQEIQLTVSSVKRLVIAIDSIERLVMTIHAPNIHYFELSVYSPPHLLFYTEAGREWKSRVVMLFDRFNDNIVLIRPWLLQLRELLKSLNESQISLGVCSDTFKNPKVEDTNDVGFRIPVPLEHLSVEGDYKSSSFPDLLNCLFLICRPRYISTTNSVTDSSKIKDKIAEFIIFLVIRNLGEMSRGYSWKQDLEGTSMQVWDENYEEWHTVRIEGAPDLTSPDRKIRFRLNWRD